MNCGLRCSSADITAYYSLTVDDFLSVLNLKTEQDPSVGPLTEFVNHFTKQHLP